MTRAAISTHARRSRRGWGGEGAPWRPAARAGGALGFFAFLAIGCAGCSGRGTYITGGPTTGQLKTSLSRLEFENDQLRTEVARLKDENRLFEDRLVREQLHSGDLAARLDDARNLIRDRGYDFDDSSADDSLSRPRTLPAGRSAPKRKPPTAQIPSPVDGEEEEIPPLILDDDRPPARSSRRKPSTRGEDSVSLRVDDDFRWIPVANGDKP